MSAMRNRNLKPDTSSDDPNPKAMSGFFLSHTEMKWERENENRLIAFLFVCVMN